MDRPKRATASRMRYNEDGSDNDMMPQESAKKQRRTSKELESDEEEAEFEEEEDVPPSRKSGRSSSNGRKKDQEAKRTTSRSSARAGAVKTGVSNYCEASSDDEFAQNNFMLPGSDDSDNDKKVRKSKGKSSRGKTSTASKSVRGTDEDADADVEVVDADANEDEKEKDSSNDQGNSESENDSESDSDGDDIEYKVQHILGRWIATPSEWVQICAHMNTREVTRGSVLQQPDEEFFSTSTEPVEKYLIKWAHASYLHVSWETQKDLAELVTDRHPLPYPTLPSPPSSKRHRNYLSTNKSDLQKTISVARLLNFI